MNYDARRIYEGAFPHVKNFGTYIDIGANIGRTTNPFVDTFEKVIAFEPNPEIFHLISDRAEKHNVALGSENKTATLVLPNGNEAHRHGHAWVLSQRWELDHAADPSLIYKIENVPVRKLDDYEITSVDFIKIDVEGGEMDVCLGAKELIRKFKPAVWFEARRKDNDHVIKWFRNEGFRIKKFTADSLAYFE